MKNKLSLCALLASALIFSALPPLPLRAAAAENSGTGDLIIFHSAKPSFLYAKKTLSGDVTGMARRGTAAFILKEYKDCYFVKSGKYTGYAEKSSTLRGRKARNLAEKICHKKAKICKETAYMYQEPDKDSIVLGAYGNTASLSIIGNYNEWLLVQSKDRMKGYLPAEDASIETTYAYAEEPDIDIYQDLYPEKALATYESDRAYYDAQKTPKEIEASCDAAAVSLGQAVADYACRFIGNPYIWGGTSLTDGCDCSGFTMKVYEHFGYSLPHYSGDQRKRGMEICSKGNYDEKLLQPGDLIFYQGHVELYIGNGQIVNAASKKSGICIKEVHYRNDFISARRILGTGRTAVPGHEPMAVSEEERHILERIVEAEAGGQGMQGKIFVADVILNRVSAAKFPDTIKKVVFSPKQFSPILDGRYCKVCISEETRQAASIALKNHDSTQGALYFMNRAGASRHNATWFDTALTRLFSYRDHEFFR